MKKGNCLIYVIIFLIIIAVIIITIYNFMEDNKGIKGYEITKENYTRIIELVNNSNDLTLQEKTYFNENYLIFGKKIIGYKVKDICKKIEF